MFGMELMSMLDCFTCYKIKDDGDNLNNLKVNCIRKPDDTYSFNLRNERTDKIGSKLLDDDYGCLKITSNTYVDGTFLYDTLNEIRKPINISDTKLKTSSSKYFQPKKSNSKDIITTVFQEIKEVKTFDLFRYFNSKQNEYNGNNNGIYNIKVQECVNKCKSEQKKISKKEFSNEEIMVLNIAIKKNISTTFTDNEDDLFKKIDVNLKNINTGLNGVNNVIFFKPHKNIKPMTFYIKEGKIILVKKK